MAKFEKRIEARRLRRKGWSIGDIAKKFDVSKSTTSAWCTDISLTISQTELLKKKVIAAGSIGRLKGAEMNRKKKLERIAFHQKVGGREIGILSKRDLLMVGLGLYWGEGTKKSTLAIVNSDPELIFMAFTWFKVCLGICEDEFRPRVFINELHKPRVDKVLTFWSHLLGLPMDQFGNTVFLKVKNKKIYENHDSYYGVLALRIRRGTETKYRIFGLVDALKNKRQVDHMSG